MVSPWSNEGMSVTTFAVSTAVWLVVVQGLSAGLGGHLTGRLRTKWVGIHTDEVYFRDTAHGFLAWAVATGRIRAGFGAWKCRPRRGSSCDDSLRRRGHGRCRRLSHRTSPRPRMPTVSHWTARPAVIVATTIFRPAFKVSMARPVGKKLPVFTGNSAMRSAPSRPTPWGYFSIIKRRHSKQILCASSHLQQIRRPEAHNDSGMLSRAYVRPA